VSTIEHQFTEAQLGDLRDFLINIGRKFAAANPNVPFRPATRL
jgi:hypothetical protein